MRQDTPFVGSMFVFTAFIVTGAVFFLAGFVSAFTVGFGGMLCWFASYSALTGLIYARGSKRIMIVPFHMALAYGGYLICSHVGFEFNFFFGIVIDNYNFTYYSLIMGLLMAVMSSPDAHEIEWAQSKG